MSNTMEVPTFAPVRTSVIASLDRYYRHAKRNHMDHHAAKMWAKLVAARRTPMPLANPEILNLAYAVNDFVTAVFASKEASAARRFNRSKTARELIAIVEARP